MKTHQLIEIENVKNANKALKSLLERTRTEIVGLGLFYGKTGLGKTRWAFKTALENGYVYMRLECNATVRDFLCSLLGKLLHITNSNQEIKGSKNEIYLQILDILQRNQNLTIFLDESDYAFQNRKILSTIRDFVDMSLASFVLITMEQGKDKLRSLPKQYYDRVNCYCMFNNLSLSDVEKLVKEVCEVSVDDKILKYIFSQSNGTMRVICKFIEALEKIGKRLNKRELIFEEIKDIITKVEG